MVTLEWAEMEDGRVLRTVCRDGVPIFLPTRYLLGVDGRGTSPLTARTYAARLLPFFVWLEQEGLGLDGVNRVALQRFKRSLVHQTKLQEGIWARIDAEKGPAVATVYQTLGATLRFLGWCMQPSDQTALLRRGRTRANPVRLRAFFSGFSPADWQQACDELLPRMKRRLVQTLTAGQMAALRSWVMDEYTDRPDLRLRNRAMMELLFDGGLRAGELLGLKVKQVDFAQARLTIRLDPEIYRHAWRTTASGPTERLPKSGERIVFLAPQTVQWLYRYWMEARPRKAMVLKHGILFCQHGSEQDGAPLTRAALRWFLKAAGETLGVHLTPHLFRHSCATAMLEDGVPLETIRFHLGHAHMTTTEMYTHVAPEHYRADLEAWRKRNQHRYGEG